MNTASIRFGWSRWWRLVLKEEREILRDQRTIVTLILMPLLLYPLLCIAFQQFFLSTVKQTKIEFILGFENDEAQRMFDDFLKVGANQPAPTGTDPALPTATIRGAIASDLESAVEEGTIHLGVRIARRIEPRRNRWLDGTVELLHLKSSAVGSEAAREIERRLRQSNEFFLESRLRSIGLEQRVEAVQAVRKTIGGDATVGMVSIAAVIPLILILMTITGAVYPAIDLTAGERERGTLEILIAAPIARLALLTSKYVAVLTVAMLTASVNLTAMLLTLRVSGLSATLFGQEGMTAGKVAAIFLLLIVFAAFFSAVLLTLTSFARSFKEAQAYLIPLMLVSMAPGMIGLMPGMELSPTGLLTYLPLVNIVLLARDVLQGHATLMTAAPVLIATMTYALLAILTAARLFGAEDVLYSNQTGWGALFGNHRRRRLTPSTGNAMITLATVFIGSFYLGGIVKSLAMTQLSAFLYWSILVTLGLYAGIPLIASRLGRLRHASAFGLQSAPTAAYIAAGLLGLGLWTIAHVIAIGEMKIGLLDINQEKLDLAEKFLGGLRQRPALLVLAALAIAPAIGEELLFRGYLFSWLQTSLGARRPGHAGWVGFLTIIASAAIFGLFHVVDNVLRLERFGPSFFLGLWLGWIRWRSGSVIPGMMLHAVNNGLIVTLALLKPRLQEQWHWDVSDQELLPVWLHATGLLIVGLGAALLLWMRRPDPKT